MTASSPEKCPHCKQMVIAKMVPMDQGMSNTGKPFLGSVATSVCPHCRTPVQGSVAPMEFIVSKAVIT